MINLKQARNDNTLCWNAKIQKVLQSSRKSLCFKCFTFISCSNFTLIFRYSTLRKKCPYSELFWPAFSCILTKYGEILSPYSSECGKMRTRMTPNMDTFHAVILYLIDANLKYNYVNDTNLLSENLWMQQTSSNKKNYIKTYGVR